MCALSLYILFLSPTWLDEKNSRELVSSNYPTPEADPGREVCSWRITALCLHLTPNLIIQITSRNYLVPGQKLFLLRFLPSTECRPIARQFIFRSLSTTFHTPCPHYHFYSSQMWYPQNNTSLGIHSVSCSFPLSKCVSILAPTSSIASNVVPYRAIRQNLC